MEKKLGPKGTPVYKRSIVEKVAEIIQNYMQQEYTVDNDLYDKIFSQVGTPGSTKLILGPDIYNLTLEDMGGISVIPQ